MKYKLSVDSGYWDTPNNYYWTRSPEGSSPEQVVNDFVTACWSRIFDSNPGHFPLFIDLFNEATNVCIGSYTAELEMNPKFYVKRM